MKKFMALLATGLVMALSATTVFAVSSVSVDTVEKVEQADVEDAIYIPEDSVVEEAKAEVVDKSAEIKADSSIAKEAVAQVEATNKTELKGVAVAAYADIVVKLFDKDKNPVEVSEENPAYIAVEALAPGLGKNVIVLNKQGEKWVEVELVEDGGKLLAKFTHFSPVMVLTYESVEKAPTTGGDSGYYAPETEETTSPKTGVLPVAAFAATICLAGAAVCGRKVK